jgi:hypothetical protein
MQEFAITHEVKNAEALPALLNALAQRQLLTLDEFLDRMDRKPDLGNFVAEMTTHWR